MTLGAVNGSDLSANPGCRQVEWNGFVMGVVVIIQVVLCLFFTGVCIYLLVTLKRKGGDLCNATGSTIVFSMFMFPMVGLRERRWWPRVPACPHVACSPFLCPACSVKRNM